MKRAVGILKQYFGRGKYPTEDQFSDVIDSMRHKDDAIQLSDVNGLNNALNAKFDTLAAEELANRIQDSAGGIEQMQGSINNAFSLIEDAVDVADGQQAQLDIVKSIAGGDLTLEQTKQALTAMGSGYLTLYSIATTLKTFLESANTATATIDTWREIEGFLQGVTDTQSLTAMLNALESKITAAYTAAVATETQARIAADATLNSKIDTTVGNINTLLEQI